MKIEAIASSSIVTFLNGSCEKATRFDQGLNDLHISSKLSRLDTNLRRKRRYHTAHIAAHGIERPDSVQQRIWVV
jgi:hypothetical protein